MKDNADLLEKTKMHPCYDKEAHHKYARIHLPVAPACNIKCRYCNRRYDCVNESRPGVTSTVLSPIGALNRYSVVKEKVENLSVVGIAGPGDALANWDKVKKTFNYIKLKDPDAIFCLSTNGLMLSEYISEIIEIGVRHVTVTLNALDPEIGEKIYKHIVYKGQLIEGKEASEILIANQLKGIAALVEAGVLVKVNTVMIEGINSFHIPEIAKKIKELGAFIGNIMPLIPAKGSDFEEFPLISMKKVEKMRELCEIDLRQMKHCRQCRADAIGKLDQDRSLEFMEKKKNILKDYIVAVASKDGKIIDQHFGEATQFLIYLVREDGLYFFLEKRKVKKYSKEREIEEIKDCNAILAVRFGVAAKEKLRNLNILPVEIYENIDTGLKTAITEISRMKVS